MKYNYWTRGEVAVVRLEAATGRLNLTDPSPEMRCILRRHSKACVRAIARYSRNGGRGGRYVIRMGAADEKD